ncbi:S1C family serine protease [Candidatus Pelagibacter sp.]|uniref:S1C family serine protease n=1 Tax=Candidatus Pelagibacter sp. TaxID=2024849 RepID=UPI003F839165
MLKFLFVIIFSILVSSTSYSNIIKLENCYQNRTTNTLDKKWLSFYENDTWQEKNYIESKKYNYPITQYHRAIGLGKISTNITKEEFSDHLLFLTSTGLSEKRKKIAEDFFKKNNLYHDKIEFEDVYFSINLNTYLVSLITIRTDEFINYRSKLNQLDSEYWKKNGYLDIKLQPTKKIIRYEYTIKDFTDDKIFASRTYEYDFPKTIIKKDLTLDLNTYIVHESTIEESSNDYINIQDEIICKTPNSSDTESEKSGSSGTAFFVSNSGHLLTNNHVVEGCSISKITYLNNEYDAQLLATDKTLDLALLKTEINPKSYFNFSKEGASKLNKIYVAGYPLGKGLSDDLKITSGIVSSLKGFDDNSNEIQIDAPINPGNSGGPIINENGDLVAIAVSGLAKDQTEGINFGIKSSAAELFLKSNKVTPKKSMYDGIKDNDKLLEILEEGTVYTYCN